MVEEPHCCFNNQPFFKSTLNNMRIPNTAEFLAIFVTTGQLTGLPNQRKINIIFLWSVRGWHTSVSISYSGRWLGLGGTGTRVQSTSISSPSRWYLQCYCRTLPRPHVSIFIGHICTFHLSVKIQIPDYMPKRSDQWTVHQSQNWRSDLFSNFCFAHSNWHYYRIGNLPWAPGRRLLANFYR